LDQEYPNLEVIVRDGRSTDGTLEIINKYVKKYPNVFSLEVRSDKGQVEAINRGLEKSVGDILTYINADDVYENGALIKVGEYFAIHTNTLWLAGRGRVIDQSGNEIAKLVTSYKNFLLSFNSYYLLLTTNYLIQPSVFLNKSIFEKYAPFLGSGGSVMEYDLWLKIGKDSMPSVISDNLSAFRITNDSLSSTLFRSILAKDFQIAVKYTKNPLILFLHYLHNLGRVAALYLLRQT